MFSRSSPGRFGMINASINTRSKSAARRAATRTVDWSLDSLRTGGDARKAIAAPYERCPLEGTLSTVMAELERADRDLAAKKRALDEAQRTPFADGSIIVASLAMRRVLELVERVARTDTTVLVTGESGVGKERYFASIALGFVGGVAVLSLFFAAVWPSF